MFNKSVVHLSKAVVAGLFFVLSSTDKLFRPLMLQKLVNLALSFTKFDYSCEAYFLALNE